MIRLALLLCLIAGLAQADTTQPEPKVDAATTECDTCLARKNGKRALREYLAQKRAQEEADANDKDVDQNDD